MTKSLNVIALISGGKDSFYTLLHCIQNGHKVVALANLYPTLPEGAIIAALENEDINSFMYQTVGHSLIPLYADALQLPLYRQQIKGTSKQTGRYYDSSAKESSSDETEDLLPLLENVKQHHPEADALCSGAILSTYQRTRIESVALRVGLTSLAYLWQYPLLPPPSSRQDSLTGLLEDMSAAGCDSRIIKVASGGMPEDLLGLNVADSRTTNRMIANMAPFFEDNEFALRGAVLGEGGEFETLALDGPRSVWKRRIEITEEDNLVVSEEGGVKWLKLGQSRAVQQDTQVEGDQSSIDLVRVPGTFDPQFEHIAALRLKVEDHAEFVPESITQVSAGTTLSHEVLDCVTAKLSLESETLVIANITAPDVKSDAAQQMEQIVSSLKEILLHISKANNIDPPLSSASIISTTLLLKSMSSFPSVNNSYARLFPIGLPNPPARVTIACSLPPNILIILSCTISLRPRSTHRGLHVQTRSYWAPANIGPYSQAICVPFNSDNEGRCEFVYMAGQIPLLPASMELFQAPFVDQALLALQHLWRVGQERRVDLWTWGVALLPRLNMVAMKEQPHIAAEVWKQAHLTNVHGKSVLGESEDGEDEDESGPDAWDLKYGRMRTARVRPSVGLHRHVLPNSAVIVNKRDKLLIPSIIVAEVEELPRSASIEWHSHGMGGLRGCPRSKSGVCVEFSEFPWGMVSVCSYRISTRSYSCKDDSDGEDPSTSQKERRDHHFVKILVSQAAMVGDKTKVPPVSEVLECVLPARSSVLPIKAEGEEKIARATDAGDRLALVHGVAYIAGVQGGAAFVALGGSESMPGITLVPCRRLWGKCYQAGTPGQKEGGIVGLTMALTLRIDTFAEGG